MVKTANRKKSTCSRQSEAKATKRTRKTLTTDSQQEIIRKRIAREKNLIHQRESRRRKRLCERQESCTEETVESVERDVTTSFEQVCPPPDNIIVSSCSQPVSETAYESSAPICANEPFQFSPCFVLGTKYDGTALLYLPMPDSRRSSLSSSTA